MPQLEENLKLGLEAVKYAKEQVRRSGNQTYFKPGRSFVDQQRNQFILGATRGGRYIKLPDGPWEKSSLMAQRRRELLDVIQSTKSTKQKEQEIDLMMMRWGAKYFWEGRPAWLLSESCSVEAIAKTLGKSFREVKDGMNNGSTADLIDLFNTVSSARKAMKFGVGNCQEKAEVACMYLMDHAPGGVRLAIYALEKGHKGVTGIFTGEGGDHVFGVYGLENTTDNIGTLGPNAIVIDGWMNDAYPARKHLDWKHGWNYNDERINLKQFTVRNMVCVSYRAHIECQRNFGMLPKGPGRIPVPPLVRTNF